MWVFAAHLIQNNTLLWVNLIVNGIEAVVLLVVVGVLCLWAKRMVGFMDLMNEMANEEKLLRSRVQEFHDGNDD